MYVLEAYKKGAEFEHKRNHNRELPQALNTSLLANINRDPKKQRTPYTVEDFCFFQSKDDRNIPSKTFGAAAMALIKNKQFPSWALFAYKDLKEAADGPAPRVLAYTGKDAIILAPQVENKIIYGMLIAQESASGSHRLLESTDGEKAFVYIEPFSGKFYCEENIGVPISFYIDKE